MVAFFLLLHSLFFFFNDTATTEIYTLSLHDALPISATSLAIGLRSIGGSCQSSSPSTLLEKPSRRHFPFIRPCCRCLRGSGRDRKSTRLNSSHGYISYAVFCLKKKNHNS